MITKYRASWLFHSKIEAAEIDRETESSVWIGGRRSAKRSRYDRYFDTWDDAHAFLLYEASKAVSSAERRFQAAKDEFRRINEMERPERQEIETG